MPITAFIFAPENLRENTQPGIRRPPAGTLDALILKTLTWGPRHGHGIAGWIKETSGQRHVSPSRTARSISRSTASEGQRGWVGKRWWGLSDNNPGGHGSTTSLTPNGDARAISARRSRRAWRATPAVCSASSNATAWEDR